MPLITLHNYKTSSKFAVSTDDIALIESFEGDCSTGTTTLIVRGISEPYRVGQSFNEVLALINAAKTSSTD
jgi:hypothetical protein